MESGKQMTKTMYVVCNTCKIIDISSMGEAAVQSHMVGKKLMELKLLSPSAAHISLFLEM